MLIAMNLCPLNTCAKISDVGVALPPSFKKPRTLKRVDAYLKIENDLHLTKIATGSVYTKIVDVHFGTLNQHVHSRKFSYIDE